jgi:hypothetical protein
VAELPQQLVDYFEQRQQARADRVRAFLDNLTDRERALVHDAAVMGYVRGTRHPRDEEIPLDPAIIADVVNACFVSPDLYPTVNAAPAHPPTATWTIESPRHDEWASWGATYDDREWARERYADAIEHSPIRHFRLVRADTTHTVEAQHDPEEA